LLLSLLLVRHRLWKPVSFKQILLAIPCVLMGIYIIGEARNDLFSSESRQHSVPDLSVEMYVAPITEMGNSARTVVATHQLVPSQRDYDYGMGYVSALATIMPNIFTSGKHPFATRCQYGDWLTGEISPETQSAGGSVAFSNVAESYINFGPFGCLIFLPYGIVMAWISIRSEATRSSRWIIFEALSVLILPIWARGSFIAVARLIGIMIVIPLILIHLISRLRKP
jgi:hypothetical protein